MSSLIPAVRVNNFIRNAPVNMGISVGKFDAGPHYRTTRPHGRSDWLLFWTVSGTGLISVGERELKLLPGSVAILLSGTAQDYQTCPEDTAWGFCFAHVPPQASWSEVVDTWSQPLPGVAHVMIPEQNLRKKIHACFHEALMATRQPLKHAKAISVQALGTLLYWADEANPGERGALDPRVRRALEFAGSRLDHHWTAAELAHEVGLSESRLRTLFREQLGEAPVLAAERLRLEFAANLISGGGMTVQEAADATGYRDPYHFSRRFKARMGQAPSRYRPSS